MPRRQPRRGSKFSTKRSKAERKLVMSKLDKLRGQLKHEGTLLQQINRKLLKLERKLKP